MPDDILPFDKTKDPALSRRTFGALSLGAGAALTTSAMAAGSIVETDVVINPTVSLILRDFALAPVSATRTSWQCMRQSPREADTQRCD